MGDISAQSTGEQWSRSFKMLLSQNCGNIVAILIIAAFAAVQALDVDEPCVLSIASPNDNVIARRLAGNWTFNKEMTEYMAKNGKPGRAEDVDKTPLEDIFLTFADDPEVLKDVPEDHCRFLKANDLGVFLAGSYQIAHIEYGITKHVFVLISSQGVPGIIYWRGNEAVTNYIMMAPAAESSNDLLFMGEDSAEKPFSALHRIGSDNFCKM